MNSIQLLGYYGGDMTHCLSAWQSTNIDLDIELPNEVKDRIKVLYEATVLRKKKSPQELLAMLAENNHHTPFEKSVLHFQVRSDIATHIHFIKHRIASINSESSRYKELDDKYYIPNDWNEEWSKKLDDFTKLSTELYHSALESLSPILGRKRAKESARYFLTYNKQIDFDFMINFRSFVNFQHLRNSNHAQKEIHELAQQALNLVKQLPDFQYTIKAFNL